MLNQTNRKPVPKKKKAEYDRLIKTNFRKQMKKNIRKYLLLIIVLTVSNLSAQTVLLTDSTLFDFWVGDWRLEWKNRDGSISKGKNSITRILDGKVIKEEFTSEIGFNGISHSVFNTTTRTWQQTWVDNQGGYYNFDSDLSGQNRIFKTKPGTEGNKQIISRMVFKDISKNSFTWDWVQSEDNGKTWTLQWQIFYHKE